MVQYECGEAIAVSLKTWRNQNKENGMQKSLQIKIKLTLKPFALVISVSL